MMESILKWLRKYTNKFVHSIAFLPAVMGIIAFVLAIIMVELDKAGVGEALNKQVRWLTLKDPDTARTIVATVAAGIISLTVFNFSMVMVVMNQAASQMSNRMLDNIVGERVQKVVLGCYIGTIAYSLFLLTNISEGDENQTVPSLSIYLLLLFTISDIFLFVYFLHYITESFRYEQLIQRIHNRTAHSLKKLSIEQKQTPPAPTAENCVEIMAKESGYFQGFAQKRLLALAVEMDIYIAFLHAEGTYVLKGTPFLTVSSTANVDREKLEKMFLDIDFYYGQTITENPYYGFQHLMEVGIKALSPGINDPGTAVLSLNALTDLLAYRMHHGIPNVIEDKDGNPRIITKERSFKDLFESSVLPIWDYGKGDRWIQQAIIQMINQLQFIDKEKEYHSLFDDLLQKAEAERKKLLE